MTENRERNHVYQYRKWIENQENRDVARVEKLRDGRWFFAVAGRERLGHMNGNGSVEVETYEIEDNHLCVTIKPWKRSVWYGRILWFTALARAFILFPFLFIAALQTIRYAYRIEKLSMMEAWILVDFLCSLVGGGLKLISLKAMVGSLVLHSFLMLMFIDLHAWL